MAIPLDEEIVLLREAAKLLPRRNGKTIHFSTLHRWTTIGCRGIVLESLQCGNSRATSRQALERFCQRLTAAAETQKNDGVAGDDRERADEYQATVETAVVKAGL